MVGDLESDLSAIKKNLRNSLSKHNENVEKENELFSIYLNDTSYWQKRKEQRADINNKVTVPSAWAITRTINGYCFGEPIKYVSRGTESKQALLEKLSEYLDFRNNHDSTNSATISASICGLGYKLVLPASQEEINVNEVPFIINKNFIFPQTAFCVYDNSVIGEKQFAVLIGDNYDSKGNTIGNKYTIWTKYFQYILVDGTSGADFDIVPQTINGIQVNGYPIFSRRIPLVEIERNAFRKGDWEVAVDLLKLKNLLVSNRADDVQQVVDYILVLMNCKFETEEDRTNAIKSRILELECKDPQNKPSLEILKNALDQNGIQIYSDYIDLLINEATGIPSRDERSGGGQDTGKAVQYRNGFRDLENNAGFIIPKMDKAELEFVGNCLAIAHKSSNRKLQGLNPIDIRCKFIRTLNDDPLTASQAFLNIRNAGASFIDSAIASKLFTDPAEAKKNADIAFSKGELLEQINTQTKTTQVVDNK